MRAAFKTFVPMDRTAEIWQPFTPENISNPYPMYERLRTMDPVHRAQTGEWIITRYEDARNALRNPQFIAGNRIGNLARIREYGKRSYDLDALKVLDSFVVFLNGADHARIRKFIIEAWGFRQVEQVISANLDQLLTNLGGQADLVNAVAKPLPAMTIGRILGLPPEDFAFLRKLGSTLVKALDIYLSLKEIIQIDEAAKSFIAYFHNFLNKPGKPGLIRDLAEWNAREKVLSETELLSSCVLLFIAGEETTSSLLGTGMFHLFSRPWLVSKLRDEPSQVGNAVEEFIRFDSPVQILGRFASENCELGGRSLEAGDTLTICLGSANRDPAQFDQPDQYLLERSNRKHLSFGGGAHYCIGDWLARTQVAMTVEALLDRFEITLESEPRAWNNNLVIRGLSHLHARAQRR